MAWRPWVASWDRIQMTILNLVSFNSNLHINTSWQNDTFQKCQTDYVYIINSNCVAGTFFEQWKINIQFNFIMTLLLHSTNRFVQTQSIQSDPCWHHGMSSSLFVSHLKCFKKLSCSLTSSKFVWQTSRFTGTILMYCSPGSKICTFFVN